MFHPRRTAAFPLLLLALAVPSRAHDDPAPSADDDAENAAAWFTLPAPELPDPVAVDAPGHRRRMRPDYRVEDWDDAARLSEFTAFESWDEPAAPDLAQTRDFHARFALRWAPAAFASGSGTLRRQGLGGITVADNGTQNELAWAAGATLLPGRLAFAVGYAPFWDERAYRYETGEGDLTRDGVGIPDAGRRFTMARMRTDRYTLGIVWIPVAGQTVTASLWGAPQQGAGRIRFDSMRTRAGADMGVNTGPPRGVKDLPATDGEFGRTRLSDHGARLAWSWAFGPWRLAAEAAQRRWSLEETPDPAADTTSYNDNRRPGVYEIQKYYGYAPVTTASQYRFGGLGVYAANTGGHERRYGLELSRDFGGLIHQHLSLAASRSDGRFRENLLRTGARGDNAPQVSLRAIFGRPIASSIIRLRGGFTAQATCGRPDPTGIDFLSACPSTVYTINSADLAPPMRDNALRDDRLSLTDTMTAGPWRFDLSARRDRVTIGSPNRYTLYSDATGQILTGSDGWEVGSRVEDVPYNPVSPPPPEYTEGKGIFVAGEYRFPTALSGRAAARWMALADDRLVLRAAVAREHELPSDHLTMHAFENHFGIALATFANPDITGQYGPTLTRGGGTALIAPGTRLAYTDSLEMGADWRVSPALRVSARLGIFRLGRALDHTQANSAEAIANRQYDFYLVNDAVNGSRYCLNCARGQYTLFPGYTPAYNSADLNDYNPAARSFLSEILSNPGENTAAGIFPRPERRLTTLALAAKWHPKGSHFAVSMQGRLLRARGNYAGPVETENGLGDPELTSIYAFAPSYLARTLYTSGDLSGQLAMQGKSPATLRILFTDERLGVDGLGGALRWRWAQGLPRTPWLTVPGSQVAAILPGSNPDYYAFDLDQDGRPDRFVLRNYTPYTRGGLGHAPAQTAIDLALRYRRTVRGGELTVGCELDNLLNDRRVQSYDDQVELPLGYIAAGGVDALSGPALPEHDEPPSDPTLRGPNPTYGLPTARQGARRVQLFASWVW